MYQPPLKRPIDIIFSFFSILILSPILVVSAFLIKLTDRGAVFFMQKRLGKDGKVFEVYKFRTMTNEKREVNREILKGDTEVTGVGQILRRLKIDELPQLFNILKGDMSFVGPRPCMPEQRKDFNEDGETRLLVRPGLTGLAQVNGNIYLSWPERWRYDRQYVESVSLWMDFQIVIRTVLVVLFGEDKFLKKPDA